MPRPSRSNPNYKELNYLDSLEYYAGILDHNASIFIAKEARSHGPYPVVEFSTVIDGVATRIKLTGHRAVDLLGSVFPHLRVTTQREKVQSIVDFWLDKANGGTPRGAFARAYDAYFEMRDGVSTVRSPESGVLTAEKVVAPDVPEQGLEKVVVVAKGPKPKYSVLSSPEGKIIGTREGTWVRSPESGDWVRVDGGNGGV